MQQSHVHPNQDISYTHNTPHTHHITHTTHTQYYTLHTHTVQTTHHTHLYTPYLRTQHTHHTDTPTPPPPPTHADLPRTVPYAAVDPYTQPPCPMSSLWRVNYKAFIVSTPHTLLLIQLQRRLATIHKHQLTLTPCLGVVAGTTLTGTTRPPAPPAPARWHLVPTEPVTSNLLSSPVLHTGSSARQISLIPYKKHSAQTLLTHGLCSLYVPIESRVKLHLLTLGATIRILGGGVTIFARKMGEIKNK